MRTQRARRAGTDTQQAAAHVHGRDLRAAGNRARRWDHCAIGRCCAAGRCRPTAASWCTGRRRMGLDSQGFRLMHVTTSRDILAAMARGQGPEEAVVALGYAGWDRGQLEDEIRANVWLNAPVDPGLIFDLPFESRWHAAAASSAWNCRGSVRSRQCLNRPIRPRLREARGRRGRRGSSSRSTLGAADRRRLRRHGEPHCCALGHAVGFRRSPLGGIARCCASGSRPW